MVAKAQQELILGPVMDGPRASFLWPGGVLLAVAWACERWLPVSDAARPVLAILPYAACLMGGVLGWRFGRMRLVYGMLFAALACWLLGHFPGDSPQAMATVTLVGCLLPINLVVLSIWAERGLRTRAGLWQLAWVGVQLAGGAVVLMALPEATVGVIEGIQRSWPYFTRLPLAQPAQLCFVAAMIVAVVRAMVRPGFDEIGALWALVALLMALGAWGTGPGASIYWTALALVLVSGAIERSHALAYGDALTGVPSRRAMEEALLRLEGDYTIAMVDIDHFKQFNDTYGHDTGDQVLRMIATRLSRVTGGGKVYRYGGEEFAIVFARRTLEAAAPHLELVREGVATSRFMVRSPESAPRDAEQERRQEVAPSEVARYRSSHRPQADSEEDNRSCSLNVTISIGAAAYDQDPYTQPGDVIKRADQALYRAKREGRNRLVLWDATPDNVSEAHV